MSADERPGCMAREGLAARLAVEGGRLALERLASASATWKPDGSMVTNVDLAVQDLILGEIARRCPADAILGEEGQRHVGPARSRYLWVVDPIDGTSNYGRGLPGFAVSIGVLRDGLPFAGAVYDPLVGWLFTACAGRGAWLNQRLLVVADRPLSAASLVAIRAPFAGAMPPFVTDWMVRYRLRRYGSTALQLCYVAMGALDLVHDHRASLWDIAGAVPVMLEAGARISAEGGEDLFPAAPHHLAGGPIPLLAGAPAAHAQALEHIRATLTVR